MLERVRFAGELDLDAVGVGEPFQSAERAAQQLRSWSSRGSHSASACATESSAHSVVPLKARIAPVG
jgi:hypothetical protein